MNDPDWASEWCPTCEEFTRQLVCHNADARPELPVFAGERNPFAPTNAVCTCRDCGGEIIIVQREI